MWCANHSEDQHHHRLILQTGDKNTTGVSFYHFEDHTSRDIEKEEQEGSHYAAHLLIRKTPDPTGGYLILIEKVPGIYLSSVKDHFTWACNRADYFKTVEDDDGQPKQFRPYFDILGHQSKTIRDALRTGVLQDVELIGQEENHEDGLDEDPIVQEVVHEARFEVKRRVSEDQAQTVFARARDFIRDFRGGADATQMFVRIKAANGQIKRTEIDYDGEEILEQAFVQNEVVNDFDPPLTQRYDAFRDDMVQKMIEVANNLGD
ncbi:hypothetical protein [Epibacterium ulvae]|uniref:hypothetical protein n=1 Tax=Epibacterium ulvae TaxID=1156985 RepID=UPI002492B0B0|nr:hypothetical protein [Epibacterium ulvae]